MQIHKLVSNIRSNTHYHHDQSITSGHSFALDLGVDITQITVDNVENFHKRALSLINEYTHKNDAETIRYLYESAGYFYHIISMMEHKPTLNSDIQHIRELLVSHLKECFKLHIHQLDPHFPPQTYDEALSKLNIWVKTYEHRLINQESVQQLKDIFNPFLTIADISKKEFDDIISFVTTLSENALLKSTTIQHFYSGLNTQRTLLTKPMKALKLLARKPLFFFRLCLQLMIFMVQYCLDRHALEPLKALVHDPELLDPQIFPAQTPSDADTLFRSLYRSALKNIHMYIVTNKIENKFINLKNKFFGDVYCSSDVSAVFGQWIIFFFSSERCPLTPFEEVLMFDRYQRLSGSSAKNDAWLATIKQRYPHAPKMEEGSRLSLTKPPDLSSYIPSQSAPQSINIIGQHRPPTVTFNELLGDVAGEDTTSMVLAVNATPADGNCYPCAVLGLSIHDTNIAATVQIQRFRADLCLASSAYFDHWDPEADFARACRLEIQDFLTEQLKPLIPSLFNDIDSFELSDNDELLLYERFAQSPFFLAKLLPVIKTYLILPKHERCSFMDYITTSAFETIDFFRAFVQDNAVNAPALLLLQQFDNRFPDIDWTLDPLQIDTVTRPDPSTQDAKRYRRSDMSVTDFVRCVWRSGSSLKDAENATPNFRQVNDHARQILQQHVVAYIVLKHRVWTRAKGAITPERIHLWRDVLLTDMQQFAKAVHWCNNVSVFLSALTRPILVIHNTLNQVSCLYFGAEHLGLANPNIYEDTPLSEDQTLCSTSRESRISMLNSPRLACVQRGTSPHYEQVELHRAALFRVLLTHCTDTAHHSLSASPFTPLSLCFLEALLRDRLFPDIHIQSSKHIPKHLRDAATSLRRKIVPSILNECHSVMPTEGKKLAAMKAAYSEFFTVSPSHLDWMKLCMFVIAKTLDTFDDMSDFSTSGMTTLDKCDPIIKQCTTLTKYLVDTIPEFDVSELPKAHLLLHLITDILTWVSQRLPQSVTVLNDSHSIVHLTVKAQMKCTISRFHMMYLSAFIYKKMQYLAKYKHELDLFKGFKDNVIALISSFQTVNNERDTLIKIHKDVISTLPKLYQLINTDSGCNSAMQEELGRSLSQKKLSDAIAADKDKPLFQCPNPNDTSEKISGTLEKWEQHINQLNAHYRHLLGLPN